MEEVRKEERKEEVPVTNRMQIPSTFCLDCKKSQFVVKLRQNRHACYLMISEDEHTKVAKVLLFNEHFGKNYYIFWDYHHTFQVNQFNNCLIYR